MLRRLQEGANLSLPYARPMPSIGRGCYELRIPDENRTWRIVYYLDSAAIVILEVFAKKNLKPNAHAGNRRLQGEIEAL